MSACLHRPESGCVLVPCANAVGSCICAAEVVAEDEEAEEDE